MSTPIEEIKRRVGIVDLVGSYVRLSKAGANFKAPCPFHNEKTPSFYVSPAREIFHCFGCNAGGDVFRFVSMIEGVEFPEALAMLAERAGVVLKREDPRLASEKKRLFDAVEEATNYYQSILMQNKAALDYLRGRGVRDESIKSFRLGFAPDSWDGVLNYLKQKGYSGQEAERVGLAILTKRSESSSRYYDRFRSRIMFPIFNPAGKTVGFSGRIFNKESEEGKYINTPNTPLYDKSHVLYLWDRAKNDVRKENACILVEGQMDALMSHQVGVKNVVATSGTALGINHLELIKRLTPKLLLAFDTDEAGESAARRAFELSLESGFDVNIVEVHSGKDPADTIREDPDSWTKSVKEAKPVIAYFLDNLKKKFSGDLYALRSGARTAVFPYIARLSNEIERAHWIQETSIVLELKEEPLWEELSHFSKGGDTSEKKISQTAENVKTRRHLVEERMIGILSWQGGKLSVKEDLKNMFSKENSPMLEAVLAGKPFPKLALEAELLYSETPDVEGEFENLFSELRREATKSRLEFLAEEIRRMELAGEKTRVIEYLKEFQNESKKLNYLWQEARLKSQ